MAYYRGKKILFSPIVRVNPVGRCTDGGGEIFNDYYNNEAKDIGTHSEGIGTIASGEGQHVQGRYNEEDTGKQYAHIVGGGSSDSNRKNIHTLDWNGTAWFAEDILLGPEKLSVKNNLDPGGGGEGSSLTQAQIDDINDIDNIRNTASGAQATASTAMSTAGTAFDLAEAAYASANQAVNGKQDKVFIETRSDMEAQFFDFSDMYNGELRLLDTPVITIEFRDDEYQPDYISGLSFDSGETPTSFVYTNSGIINWVGTDCSISEGLSVFAPAANTHYDVVFYYNGAQFIGLVNGFKPATSNESAVSE